MRRPAPVTVIVPCYNEQAGLPSLIARLETLMQDGGRGWQVLFVDDGSADATFARLLASVGRQPWAVVVRHPTNFGLGAALRTGFRLRELPMRLGTRRFGESKLKIGDAIVAHASLLTLTATLVATRRLRALVPGAPAAH